VSTVLEPLPVPTTTGNPSPPHLPEHPITKSSSPTAASNHPPPHYSESSSRTKSNSPTRARNPSPPQRPEPSRTKSNSPKSSSPCNSATVGIPYDSLTPAEQAAQDAETDSAVAQAQEEIEIDSGADASSISDAGYETDSLRSASTSLSSSVRDYAFENGRRYHKFREGAYNFPNDDSEQDREDMKHAMMVNLLGGRLHFAPIGDNPQNVLDVGTGTGIWAIESRFLPPRRRRGVVLMLCSGRLIPGIQNPWCRSKSYTARMGPSKRQIHG
jgi:hypothetical protein